jgi:hypothetical protein
MQYLKNLRAQSLNPVEKIRPADDKLLPAYEPSAMFK